MRISVSVTTKWQPSGQQEEAGRWRKEQARTLKADVTGSWWGLWRQTWWDRTFTRSPSCSPAVSGGSLAALPVITPCWRLQLRFPLLINILACFFWWYYKQGLTLVKLFINWRFLPSRTSWVKIIWTHRKWSTELVLERLSGLQAAGEGNEHIVEVKPCMNDNSSFLDVAIEIKWHKSMFDIRIQIV